MAYKKTICVDFDGVLHLYESGWKSLEIIEDNPVPGAFDFLTRLVEAENHDHEGNYRGKKFDVCIYSARSATQAGIMAMKEWFRKHGLPEKILRDLAFPDSKPAAVVYIDDRAWRFDGVFPTIEELETFKPWNKR